MENTVEVSWLTDRSSLLMQDAIVKGSEALLEKGVLGIMVVILISALVWMMFENRRIQRECIEKVQKAKDDQLVDAKQNTKDMLEVYEKVDVILDRLEEFLDRVEKLK